VTWLSIAIMLAGCALGRDAARALPEDRAAPLVYVALGDSTVEGVGASRTELNYVSRLHASLRTVYPNARLVNLGVAGATSADVIASPLERALALHPDLVTLSIGPNDITGRVPVETFERNLDTILGRLARETRAVIVLNLLPDLAVTPRFARSRARDAVGRQTVAFNEALTRRARAYGVEPVDLYAPSRDEVPRRPELVWSDGYHPSDAGYARWAELLWKGVEARIAVR
jgi:lysophospholipase L1-like esterase